MRNWAKWCLSHRLSFVVYLVWFISVPAYVAIYIQDGLSDWLRDLRAIRSEASKLKGGAQ